MPAKRTQPDPSVDGAITTKAGTRYRMSDMTGRDFLRIRELLPRAKVSKLTEDDVAVLFDLIERRTVECSVDDPLDRPIVELIEVLSLWYGRRQDAALPPASATS